MNKNATRRALGRGLSNLIPVESEERGGDDDIVMVDANAISANPFQPRTEFVQDEIDGLARSIESQGLMQPLVVRKKVDGYEIISGERRFRALKQLGRDKISCIVKAKVTDREMLELAIVENVQRENLTDIECANAYQKLLVECNLSHDELSKRVGKSRSLITNTLRLLRLPAEVQNMLRDGRITAGHARAILSLEDQEQQKILAGRIVDESLSVRECEALAQKKGKRETAPFRNKAMEAPPLPDPNVQQQIEQLQYRYGTAVKIVSSPADKGTVEIHFQGKDDLDRILGLLLGRE